MTARYLLDEGRAAELAMQILRIRQWENTLHGQVAREGGAIDALARTVTVYAPDADPALVGRILMGLVAVLAHTPHLEFATPANMIAAAGADLIGEAGGAG